MNVLGFRKATHVDGSIVGKCLFWVLGLLSASQVFGFTPPQVTQPFGFERNNGQLVQANGVAATGVSHVLRFQHQRLYLSPRGLHLVTQEGAQSQQTDILFEGANLLAQVRESEPVPGTWSYFTEAGTIETQRSKTVTYLNLWPGIDFHIQATGKGYKYEFHVAAGANPRNIRLHYPKVKRLEVQADGSLLLANDISQWQDAAPVAFQQGQAVPVQFEQTGNRRIGFAVGKYDPSQPLVIDPAVEWYTHFGSGSDEFSKRMAVNATQTEFSIIGVTNATTFPNYTGVSTNIPTAQNNNIFISTFTVGGTHVRTYIFGGDSIETAGGIAYDAAGNLFAAGFTLSNNLPTTANAFQKFRNSTNGNTLADGWLAKISATGTLQWLTYFGGSGRDEIRDIQVDANGSVVVAGSCGSSSASLPAGYTLYGTSTGAQVFGLLGKWTTNGSPIWMRLVSASQLLQFNSVAVSPTDSTIAAGGRSSTNANSFVVVNPGSVGLVGSPNGSTDGIVVEVSPNGQTVLRAGFVGGSDYDEIQSISYVTTPTTKSLLMGGRTRSTNFPTTIGAVQTLFGGGNYDGFVLKYDAGTGLVFSTYLGGNAVDEIEAVALDATGDIYAAGNSSSTTNLPILEAIKTPSTGNTLPEAYLAKLNNVGQLKWATILGSSSHADYLTDVKPLASGNLLAVGTSSATGSTQLVAGISPLQTPLGGNDAWLIRLKDCPGNQSYVYSTPATNQCFGRPNQLKLRWGPTIAYQVNPPVDTFMTFKLDTLLLNLQPATPGTYTYTITATEGGGCAATITQVLTLTQAFQPSVQGPTGVVCRGDTVTLTAFGGTAWEWQPMPVSVSGATAEVVNTSPTTYTLTARDANGCKALATFTVNFSGSSTAIQASASDLITCGNPVKLIPSGGVSGSYSWLDGTNPAQTVDTLTVQPAVTTTYTLQGREASGCIGTATVTITVSSGNAQPITVTTATPKVCPGEIVTLKASGANSYAWNGIPGADTLSLPVGLNNVSVVVTGTSSNGCTGSTTFTIVVDTALQVNIIGGADTVVCKASKLIYRLKGADTYQVLKGTATIVGDTTVEVTVNQSQQVVVRGRRGSVCNGSDTLNITVEDYDLDATATTPFLCPNGTTKLKANTLIPGGVYVWAPATGLTSTDGPEVTATLDATVTYTVTATSPLGCTHVDTLTVAVGPQYNPVIAWEDPAPVVCQQTGIFLVIKNPQAGSSYVYTPNIPSSPPTPGNIKFPVSLDQTTTFTVTGTFASGCVVTNTLTVEVKPLPTFTVNGPARVCPGAETILSASSTDTIPYSFEWKPANLLSNTFGSTVKAYPTQTTTYTVTSTSQFGCKTTQTITVKVEKPLLRVNASQALICAGDTVEALAEGATRYIWEPGISDSSGTQRLAPTTTTTYTVRAVDGCTTNDSFEFTIQVQPNPVPVIVPTATGFTTTEPYDGYQWFINGDSATGVDARSRRFESRGDGVYTVLGISANGCAALSAPITVSSVSPALQRTPTWKLYPNPAEGYIVLDLHEATGHQAGTLRCQIIDALGRTVLDIPVTDPKLTIQLQDWIPGMYQATLVGQVRGQQVLGSQTFIVK